MMRFVLAIALLAATMALSFAPIHCAFEFSDSAEPCCEFCHAGDLAATVPAPVKVAVPLTASARQVAQTRPVARPSHARLFRDRGPPRSTRS